MVYIDYFRCRRAYTEKNNRFTNYVLWSEGYCAGNIIEVREKENVMERGKLYEIIYTYGTSNTFCRVTRIREVEKVPSHVKNIECEYPYQEPIVSFIQRQASKSDKLFDVYFTIKDKESGEAVLFHTNWNGNSKERIEKEVKKNFLTLDMGYPWNIVVCQSNKPVPDKLFETIQQSFDNGTYNEWEAIEF